MSDPAPYSFSYAFSLDGHVDDIVVFASSSPPGGPYPDLLVGGSFGGSAITGTVSYGGADNVEGSGPGFFDGLDTSGLSFQTANGIDYNIFSKNGAVFLTSSNGIAAVLSSPGYTTTAPPCYLRGTRIATPSGEVAVEELAAGDLVLTAGGAARPIRWIGHRAYQGRFALANPAIQPVRFCAGSLGGGLPRRDLLVSANHAMFLDGVLVPAGDLVDGIGIRRERDLESVEYFHVELETHDVLLAEGAPAESFVDDDSLGLFHNAGTHPDFGADGPGKEVAFCAPRLTQGYLVQAIRDRLARSAQENRLAA